MCIFKVFQIENKIPDVSFFFVVVEKNNLIWEIARLALLIGVWKTEVDRKSSSETGKMSNINS